MKNELSTKFKIMTVSFILITEILAGGFINYIINLTNVGYFVYGMFCIIAVFCFIYIVVSAAIALSIFLKD